METLRPASPTYDFQVRSMPASMETRALTDAGSTDSRYSASCSSNHSRHGTDTTRALMPSSFSVARASTAICTSEPVARKMTSGVPFGASASTYAPLATCFAEANTSPLARSSPRSNTGMFWRVSAIPAGPLRRSRIVFQAYAVSLASPGRTMSRPGIARRVASCSIGWWVGPSSPRATESCVQTKIDGAFMSAARRTAGRM